MIFTAQEPYGPRNSLVFAARRPNVPQNSTVLTTRESYGLRNDMIFARLKYAIAHHEVALLFLFLFFCFFVGEGGTAGGSLH